MASTEAQTPRVVIKNETPAEKSATPRKRRKRAATTGAADDCFACQERQTKCDRRRPYCTQCLELGKDCSGYKTKLTWNVGVASRGKLRGLSLPIAKSKKVIQREAARKDEKKNAKETTSPTPPTSPKARQSTGQDNPPTHDDIPRVSVFTKYDFVNMDPSPSTASPMLPPPNFEWRMPAAQGGLRSRQRPTTKRVRRHSLQTLQVPGPQASEAVGIVPMSANVLGGFDEHLFGSPNQYSPINSTYPGLNGPASGYKDTYSQQNMLFSPISDDFMTGYETLGWPRESLSSSVSSDQSSRDYNEDDTFFADPIVASTLDHILSDHNLSEQQFPSGQIDDNVDKITESSSKSMDEDNSTDFTMNDYDMLPPLMLAKTPPSIYIGNTPGLQFLINYYDKVIAPVIVAFDGPTNPYRSHILRLAVESESLQHAIAALSASNLRMRRGSASSSKRIRRPMTSSSYNDSVLRSSMAHDMLDVGVDNSVPLVDESSQEELHHKGASIKALNEQLANPLLRKNDSILATLLILCLYHICDTGVAKFKTQFAGVKKILALRASTPGCQSKETKWMTTMFTWFDAMTATVNDREGQLRGDDAGLASLDGDEWALENLAGCDAGLFKIIANLGRLNLMSQNKSVTNLATNASPTPKVQPSNRAGSPQKTSDYYSIKPTLYDGNGWGPMAEDDHVIGTDFDSQARFYNEWTSIRKSLEEWKLESPTSLPVYPEHAQINRRDLSHISESFRYSALLYTERLAFPHSPSSDDNFQKLVAQALYHIRNVKSDVYLLWPLFITGSECVEEGDRECIRQRCLNIQKDSGFFNNISGLELLEKMWAADMYYEAAGDNLSPCGNQGFKWRNVMEDIDGEYIVV